VIFTPCELAGVYLVDVERYQDDRGFFARTWCASEFREAGLPDQLTQSSVSWSARKGTLRGMHWQAEPYAEDKLIRCTHGAIHDVVIDLRPDSDSYLRPMAVVLRAPEHRALFVPKGFAHGFQTLEDETEVFYQMTRPYVSEAARGLRWNDPTFDIRWPLPDPILHARDAHYPDFDPVA
jgi:dTDP-4-dehydrorhamnose 3,5-epimerase